MNFFQIIDKLAEVDPDTLGRFDSRRAIFSSLGDVAKRTALAASPLFLGALFQKAYAGETGTKATAVEVLNYALTLELLEADFYRLFLAANTIPTGAPTAAITKIKQHEDAHVTLLAGTNGTGGAIRGAGGTPVSGVRFKTSAFPSTYAQQLVVAQVLEDTGVRAYKGRAGELLGTDLLTVALQIHSVEARHAAHIRTMRGQRAWVNPSDDLAADPAYNSGVTGTTNTNTPFGYTIPAYMGPSKIENNVTQSSVNLTSDLGTTYLTADAAAAFDEYLQAAEILDASRAGGLVM
jgi:hypothetical protein